MRSFSVICEMHPVAYYWSDTCYKINKTGGFRY